MPDLEARLASADLGDVTDAARAGLRKSAEDLLERSRALPAPCGCAPTVRCDRHCRATIRVGPDIGHPRRWFLECNGGGFVDGLDVHKPFRTAGWNLPALHQAATEHVARHRLRAFARTE